MSTNSSRTSNVIESATAATNHNQLFIMIIIGVTALAALLFAFSKTFRVNRVVNNMDLYQNFQTLESMKPSLLKKYRLGDFYVSSAANCGLSGYQYLDYITTDMVKKTLQSGARYLEFQIFGDQYGKDARPIISSGFKRGEWKLTLNALDFEDAIKVLRDNAFRVFDGTDGSPNYRDPLFISLNLKTNNNYVLHNKIQTIINKYFLDYLLDPSYNYQSRNLALTPLSELMSKVVIFSSDGFQGSKLEEIVNYSWGFAKMKRISMTGLIDQHRANMTSGETSIENNILKKKYQKGDISRDKYEKELEKTKSIIETNQLKKFNYNNLTVVYPQEEGDFWSSNYDPQLAWKLGCQFVLMNFQNIGREMDVYITRFRYHSFVLKPKHLRQGYQQS